MVGNSRKHSKELHNDIIVEGGKHITFIRERFETYFKELREKTRNQLELSSKSSRELENILENH